jgi:rRNA maturation endonuclease Nob1
MCKFCEEREDISELPSLTISISSKYLDIYYDAYSCDSSFHEYIEINYCPKCGKKIKKDVQDTENT